METKIVRTGLFTKKADLTVAQFRDYWHYHHAAIASHMHGMMKYDQNHVVRKVDLGDIPSTSRECEGMSQIWFANMQGQKSNDPETMTKLAADERILFRTMDLVVSETKVFKQMKAETPYVKYMCFVKRAKGLDLPAYQMKLDDAAEKIMEIPGCIEYRAGNVIERLMDNVQGDRTRKADEEAHAHPSWISAGYEDVPIDSVLEIYFKFSEETSIDNIFDSPEGKAAIACLKEIVSETSSYLCDVHHIVNKF